MTEPVLELVRVSKDIRKKTIVEPLSLKLDKGQVLALCGGNGAGKSTILRMIAGISQPSSGHIAVGGVTWRGSRRAYAEQLGYMPDDFQFGYSLTAWETLLFYAALRGVKDEKRVGQVLERVGLSDVRHKPVATFSKGMRQRLLFGQALLGQPKLLVLDEPTNGLDPYWLLSFAELINEQKRAGMSVVFSTHNLEVAELTADRIVLLNEGKVLEEGTVGDFRRKYGAGGLQAAFAERFAAPDNKYDCGTSKLYPS